MDDSEEEDQLRQAIPGCLAAIGTQRAVQVLLALLADHQSAWGDALIEALGELHRRKGELIFDPPPIEAAIGREVVIGQRGNGGQSLRRATGLLALMYDPEDIHRAYAGLCSSERALRSNALELLDNLLRPEHKRELLPAIERWLSER